MRPVIFGKPSRIRKVWPTGGPAPRPSPSKGGARSGSGLGPVPAARPWKLCEVDGSENHAGRLDTSRDIRPINCPAIDLTPDPGAGGSHDKVRRRLDRIDIRLEIASDISGP